MNDYLCKPYEFADLQAVLRKLLPEPKAKAKAAQLDRTALGKITALQREGTDNILHRLIDVYLKTSPTLMDNLAEAVAQKNAKDVRLTAHSLKSSSAGLGATKLAGLCRHMEKMGDNTQLEHSGATFMKLRTEFGLVCDALSHERANV